MATTAIFVLRNSRVSISNPQNSKSHVRPLSGFRISGNFRVLQGSGPRVQDFLGFRTLEFRTLGFRI